MTDHLGHAKHQAPEGGAGNIRNGTRGKTVLTDAAERSHRGAAGPGRHVRAGDRQEASAAAVRCGRGRDLAVRQGADHRGDQRALRRGVRGEHLQGHDLAGSPTRWWRRCRRGARDRCRACTRRSSSTRSTSRSATGRSATSRSTPRSGSTWAGTGRARAVGRQGRWGVGEVLDERADGPEEPRRDGRLLHRVRRAERAARRGQHRLPGRDRAGLRDPPDPGHLALRLTQVLGPAGQGPERDLHRTVGGGGLGGVRRARGKWGKPYPAIPKLWRAAWDEFTPFLAYDVEIRRVLFSTNAIESLNARYRRAVGARGHFPTEQAALKTLYLVTRGMDPKGTGQARWTMRWKPALNAFAVTFADRMPAAENL